MITISAAALLGNWVGGQLRYLLTGEKVQAVSFVHTTPAYGKVRNIPVATKFFPALLFALAGKPHALLAFLGGIWAGALVPDAWEAAWLERVLEPALFGAPDVRLTTLMEEPPAGE
ncbi:MAG: hypothetical protein P8046_14185 [Anaerolineales bacterium]